MLRSLARLHETLVMASDGEVGTLQDVFFEDEHWTVRYVVVKGSAVDRTDPILVSPIGVSAVDEDGTIHLAMTCGQAHDAPGLELDRPVSVEMERAYYDYHGWPYYWQGNELWGQWGSPADLRGPAIGEATGAHPVALGSESDLMPGPEDDAAWIEDAAPADKHLRSVQELHGYHLEATDGHIGHVMDFVLDDHTWRIACVAIDTSDWWFGKKVAVPTSAFGRIEWETRTVFVELDKAAVKAAGEFDAERPACPGE